MDEEYPPPLFLSKQLSIPSDHICSSTILNHESPFTALHSIVFKTATGACFNIQPNTPAWMSSLMSTEPWFSWKGEFSAIKARYFCSSFATITMNKKNPWMTWTINSSRFFLKYSKATEITSYPALHLRITTLCNVLESTRQSNQERGLNGERLE